MSKGINKAILVGNLGNDPEIRQGNAGAFTTCSLATSSSWKDANGQEQSKTEWHNVVAYGRLGEIMGQYLKKGSKIYVEGSIRTSQWRDDNGQDRYSTQIVAREMQMLDSKGANSGDSYSKPAQPKRSARQQSQGDMSREAPPF